MSGSKGKKADDKKGSLWGRYQTLLVRRPLTMNIVQSGIIAAAGNITAQLVADGEVSARPMVEQVVLAVVFIAPIVSMWFSVLAHLRLHWVTATIVDQFVFSPVFNITIFWFISAFFQGGIVASPSQRAGQYDLTLSFIPSAFPSPMAYEPMWATQVKAYYLWLPAGVVRERLVPAHMKALFNNAISFLWSIVFAFVLAAN